MEIIETGLQDCVIIKSTKFGDDRGFFLESFNKKKLFETVGVQFDVKQVNLAKSQKNVLRGLHFQLEPYAQSKIVGVIAGAVLDVVVDIRENSPSYLQSFKLKIDSEDTFLFVPKGFAHGYYTLVDNTVFYYAVDQFYSPEHERGIRYDDPTIGINWDLRDVKPIISQKDLNQSYINN